MPCLNYWLKGQTYCCSLALTLFLYIKYAFLGDEKIQVALVTIPKMANALSKKPLLPSLASNCYVSFIIIVVFEFFLLQQAQIFSD